MIVAATSLGHWHETVLPSLGKRQQAVMKAFIALGRSTLREVAAHLQMPVHAVSGRITELQQAHIIEICGRDQNARANIYHLCPVAPPAGTAKKTKKQKRKKKKPHPLPPSVRAAALGGKQLDMFS